MDKIKKINFPTIMTIFTLIIFILFFIFPIKIYELNYKYIVLILGLIPVILYLLITIISNIFKNKKYTKLITNIITSILTFLLVGYYIIVLFISLLIDIEHPNKNIKYYNQYIKDDYLLTAFPKEIPENIENTKLIYSPGLLQGGTTITLYYIDNNLNIKIFDKKYTTKSIWIGLKKDYPKKDGLLTSFLSNTPVKLENKENFKIYLIDSNCDKSGYCNHGKFLLVAINEETKEVIYTSQQW